jgi:hypothetical protein
MPTPLDQRLCYASCRRDVHPKSYQIVLGAGSLGPYESLPYKAVTIGAHGGSSVLIRLIDPRKRPISGVLVASASCGKPDAACRPGARWALRLARMSIRPKCARSSLISREPIAHIDRDRVSALCDPVTPDSMRRHASLGVQARRTESARADGGAGVSHCRSPRPRGRWRPDEAPPHSFSDPVIKGLMRIFI